MNQVIRVFVLLAAAALACVSARSEVAAPIDIPNARTPLEGLLTGGTPSPAQIAEAARLGYRTVINLLPPDEPGVAEEAEQVQKLGMRYVSIPVSGAEDLTPDKVDALAEALAEPSGFPVLMHCSSGNRVGALLALKAYRVDGKSAAESLELGLKAGLTKLESAVRAQLGL